MMPQVDFDQFSYYPSLRTRLWELRGYRELLPADKARLLPTFVLAKHHQTSASNDVAAIVGDATGNRNYILDLETNPIYSCADMRVLCDPTNGFARWRAFVGARPSAVPVALLLPGVPVRELVRQIVELERAANSVVVRTRNPSNDITALTAMLSAVNSIDNILVVLDFGYIRTRVRAVTIEAADAINAIRAIDSSIRIAVMASSYPRAASAYSDSGATLEIEERILHESIGGDAIAIYADHSSIHPEPFEPMKSRFVPRVDYALPDTWIFRRVREDQGGFSECASRIVALADWDQELVDEGIWGAQRIADAAQGNLVRMGTPGAWIAVRVNLHLHQQINYGPAPGVEDAEVE